MKAYIIETQKLSSNIRAVLSRAGDVPVWAVLKGNAYGIGIDMAAEILSENGISRFAVTETGEAEALRSKFDSAPILMLRQTYDAEEIRRLAELRVIFTVGSMCSAQALDFEAKKAGMKAEVHLKVDTGMGRFGFLPEESDKLCEVFGFENLSITGIYTHFSCAFCNDKLTNSQFDTFMSVAEKVSSAGHDVGMLHCCNSNAFLRFPRMYQGGIRIGSALLGRVEKRFGLEKVGFCEASVSEIRILPKGHSVGYGASWIARRPTKVATIDVGWYHGFGVERAPDLFRKRDTLRSIYHSLTELIRSKSLFVTVNGKRCKVIGHIGMVHTSVDVTDIECSVGDKVIMEINPLFVKGLDIIYR